MGELEETSELRLDFTKLEKVGGQVAASRAAGAAPDPGVIPVAVQNADTREVILVAYTNEHAMRESFAKRKLILWSTSRNKLWFKGETSGETFDLLEAYVNCEQNSLLYVVSRNKLWFKGETSGETFDLLEAYVNCEQNSLLYVVRPCRGGICHTKNKAGAPRNCYYRKIDLDTLKLEFVDP